MLDRRALLPYLVVSASMSLGYGAIYTLLGDLKEEFGFRETELGLIVGAGFAGGFVAQIGLARLADRGYASVMVRVGVLLGCVGMLVNVFAEHVWEFVGSRALVGLGSGMIGPAIRRVVITRDPENIGINLGKQGSYDIAGFVVGPLLAALLRSVGNLHTPFIALAILYGLLFLMVLRLNLESGRTERSAGVLRQLMRVRNVRAAMCTSVAFFITIGFFEALWSVLLKDRGASTNLVGLSLSLFTLPMVFLAPIGGRVAQQQGPLRVAAWTIAVAMICTASYGYLPLWPILVISLVHAIADSFTMPANQVAVALSSPREHIAAGQGLLGAVGVAVAGLTGVSAGWAYDHLGREAVFLGAAGLMAVFLLIALHQEQGLRAPAARAEPAAAH